MKYEYYVEEKIEENFENYFVLNLFIFILIFLDFCESFFLSTVYSLIFPKNPSL
jgi:hypothetical protein